MTHLCQTYNNEKVNENSKIRQDINSELISSIFIQLPKFIDYGKMDDKDNADITK